MALATKKTNGWLAFAWICELIAARVSLRRRIGDCRQGKRVSAQGDVTIFAVRSLRNSYFLFFGVDDGVIVDGDGTVRLKMLANNSIQHIGQQSERAFYAPPRGFDVKPIPPGPSSASPKLEALLHSAFLALSLAFPPLSCLRRTVFFCLRPPVPWLSRCRSCTRACGRARATGGAWGARQTCSGRW